MKKANLFENAFSQVSEGESIEHIKNSDIFKNSFIPKDGKNQDIELINLNDIVPRFENKYIRDPKTLKALTSSIKNNGLIQPIVLIPIKDRLNTINKKDNEMEFNYLKEMLSKNKIYTISSGHRRYEAYINLLLTSLGIKIENENNVYQDLTNNIELILEKERDFFKENKNIIDENALKKEIYGVLGLPSKIDSEIKKFSYLYIPSIIQSENKEESRIYNDTNVTARPLTQLEIVINANDDVKNKFGDKFIELYKKDSREGYNSALSRYIEEQYNIEISANRIAKIMRINSLYSKEIIDCIFEGKLSARDAYELSSIYERVDKEALLEDIRNNSLDLKKLKNKFTNKRLKKKKEKYTVEELRKFILMVKNNEMSLEELFEKAQE